VVAVLAMNIILHGLRLLLLAILAMQLLQLAPALSPFAPTAFSISPQLGPALLLKAGLLALNLGLIVPVHKALRA